MQPISQSAVTRGVGREVSTLSQLLFFCSNKRYSCRPVSPAHTESLRLSTIAHVVYGVDVGLKIRKDFFFFLNDYTKVSEFIICC